MTDIVTRMSEQKDNWESTVSAFNGFPADNLIEFSCIHQQKLYIQINQTNDIFRAKKPVDLNKLFHQKPHYLIVF